MILFFIAFTVAYALLILAFIYGFESIKSFDFKNDIPKTKFSIIIPFKNEEKNLPALIESILNLEYPRDSFEVILVDDDSNDASVTVIKNILQNKVSENVSQPINLTIIKNNRLTPSPKKDAISTAIKKAQNEWIITTDADCLLPKQWLNIYNQFIRKKDAVFIAGPVKYQDSNSFLKSFQTLELLSLIGATIGGFGIKKPFLCNGANLAYKRTLFFELNGFAGNTKIASGDDVFLMEKAVNQHPNGVHYLKSLEATVTTSPQQNLKGLINQRLRWAAKTLNYTNTFAKLTGAVVFFMNILLILGVILATSQVMDFQILSIIFLFKFILDYSLMKKSANFFNCKSLFLNYTISSFIYPFFSVFIALASFGGFSWKGRYYRK